MARIAALATLVLMLSVVPPGVGAETEPLHGLLGDGKTLVLGEIHGSREIPRFTLGVVRAAVERAGTVVLGLEIWTPEQQRLDRYVASQGEPRDRKALLEGPFWQSVDDGRSSDAMLELIEGARRLVGAGASLSVFCFDDLERRPGETRDDAMGRTLAEHRTRNKAAQFVVLTGNIHARTATGTPWDPDLVPMTAHLERAAPGLTTLNARHSGGTFWACTPGCGIQKFGGRGREVARGVELFERPDELGFDGVFDVGPATASLPAVRADADR